MKKILLILFFFFSFGSLGHATCNKTITSALTEKQICGTSETLTVESTGSITLSTSKAVDARNGVGASNTTVINHGLISATSETINMKSSGGTNKITNTGTINTAQNESVSSGIAVVVQKTDGTEIDNSGTIHGGNYAIQGLETDDIIITNSGTISANNGTGPAIYLTNGTNATITNTGTITSPRHGIRLGKSHGSFNNATIINSGLIAGTTHINRNSIYVSDDNNVTSGFNLITKGEGRYDGKILLSDQNGTTGVTFFDFTLDCSISRDQTIEIHEKQNVRVINNLCGNDTYEILDSNLNPDPDNSETNGYLRIYGEELDVVSNNKKYRTEILSNTLNNIFKSLSDLKERSTFYTQSKRNNIYENSIKGVSGYFLKNEYEEQKTRAFLAYFEQNANFNSKEKSKSENLAFGYDIKTNINNLSIKPLIGISSNKITDIETESNQIIKNNFIGQFLALHSNYKLKRKIQNNNDLTLIINGEYGAHRLPKYVSNFTHGDLSVDEAIDQVLGVGFDVEYSIKNKNGFILKPYAGLAFNKTLSGKIKMNDINGAGLKEDISQDHTMNGAVAKKIGFSLTKNTEDIGLSFNFEHSNQNNVVNNNLNFSISKKLQRIAKRKEEEKLDPELENLFDQLQVVRENERLAIIANKLNNENQAMKELIIQLIKENQKIKTENKLLLQNIKKIN